jgi:hypothetical protein
VQIRKEALWAGFAMKPDHEAMITVCLLAQYILISLSSASPFVLVEIVSL